MIDVNNQEKRYVFNEFTHEDALQFGLNVLEVVKEEKLKNVRIRVTCDNDIVFQYLMNDKNGEMWLNRKEKTVMESGHSSLYVFQNQDQYKHMLDNDEYAVCGGGFPLIINGELRGTLITSGLDHEEDHMLIIKALKKMGK